MDSPARPLPEDDDCSELHALSVDVEDYFQAPACRRRAPRYQWDDYPLRVEDNVHRLLDLFDERGAKATFFVPGCVARRCKHLVVEIGSRGHEIGCYGFWLRDVEELGPNGFEKDVREATRVLEDASGGPICGFRAPRSSIVEGTLWALDILEQLGYAFDSSVRPYARGRHGFPGFPRQPVVVSRRESQRGGGLVEFPHASVKLCGTILPGPSAGFLRALTGSYCRWALRRNSRIDQQPGQVSLSAWEIDVDQPRLTSTFVDRLRQYRGLRGVEAKLTKLLDRFAFAPLGTVLERRPSAAAWTPARCALTAARAASVLVR